MALALIPAASAIGSAVSALSSVKNRRRKTRGPVVTTVSTRRLARLPPGGPTMMVVKSNGRAQKGRGKKGKHPSGGSKHGKMWDLQTSAPVATGHVSSSTAMAIGAATRGTADYPPHMGMNMRGSTYYQFGVRTGSDYDATHRGALSSSVSNCVRRIRPAIINNTTRLNTFATIFDQYRFNTFKVTYVPIVSTATSGAIHFAVQVDSDATTVGATDASPDYVHEFIYSAQTPVWQSASITVDMRGAVKCYQNDVTDSSDEIHQFNLIAIAEGGAVSTTYGHFIIEYDLDFYGPRPIFSSPEAKMKCGVPSEGLVVDSKVKLPEEKSKLTLFRKIDNDDVKSLYEEELRDSMREASLHDSLQRVTIKRSEPIPTPRPPSLDKGKDAKKP